MKAAPCEAYKQGGKRRNATYNVWDQTQLICINVTELSRC
jgi:hypothetical protein